MIEISFVRACAAGHWASSSWRFPSADRERPATHNRRQVVQGLDGDRCAALKPRVFPREWFRGKIRLEPLAEGGLMAQCKLEHGRAFARLRTSGHGGGI